MQRNYQNLDCQKSITSTSTAHTWRTQKTAKSKKPVYTQVFPKPDNSSNKLDLSNDSFEFSPEIKSKRNEISPRFGRSRAGTTAARFHPNYGPENNSHTPSSAPFYPKYGLVLIFIFFKTSRKKTEFFKPVF